jgi:hypothetical protein
VANATWPRHASGGRENTQTAPMGMRLTSARRPVSLRTFEPEVLVSCAHSARRVLVTIAALEHCAHEGRAPRSFVVVDVGHARVAPQLQHLRFVHGSRYFAQPDEVARPREPHGFGDHRA